LIWTVDKCLKEKYNINMEKENLLQNTVNFLQICAVFCLMVVKRAFLSGCHCKTPVLQWALNTGAFHCNGKNLFVKRC